MQSRRHGAPAGGCQRLHCGELFPTNYVHPVSMIHISPFEVAYTLMHTIPCHNMSICYTTLHCMTLTALQCIPCKSTIMYIQVSDYQKYVYVYIYIYVISRCHKISIDISMIVLHHRLYLFHSAHLGQEVLGEALPAPRRRKPEFP